MDLWMGVNSAPDEKIRNIHGKAIYDDTSS